MVTSFRVLAFLLGVPLLVLGVIRMGHAFAAQPSARERGDGGGRHEVGPAALRRVWPLMAGAALLDWAMNPFTGGRVFAVIGLCAAAYAVAVTSALRWRGTMRGDWRWVVAQSLLVGSVYGVVVASAVAAHGVRYAAILFVPILLLIVGLRVVCRRDPVS
jgi:hypothetical protein